MTERKTEHSIMTQFRSGNLYISFGVDHNYLRHFALIRTHTSFNELAHDLLGMACNSVHRSQCGIEKYHYLAIFVLDPLSPLPPCMVKIHSQGEIQLDLRFKMYDGA